MVTFRSVVVAVTAIGLNLLCAGAAYGVVAAVFQNTWAEGLLHFRSNGAIVSWLPLFLFVVLFGLSMDYHVFVVSRIREAVLRGVPTRQAVAEGITGSAGVVTSAAAVMIGVFAVFATLSTLDMKQLGVGLAVGDPDRRDDHPRGRPAERDDPARRRQLVGPEVAPPQARQARLHPARPGGGARTHPGRLIQPVRRPTPDSPVWGAVPQSTGFVTDVAGERLADPEVRALALEELADGPASTRLAARSVLCVLTTDERHLRQHPAVGRSAQPQ